MTLNTKVHAFDSSYVYKVGQTLTGGDDFFVMAYLQQDQDLVRPSGFKYSHANE
jgi:hypothetical protein